MHFFPVGSFRDWVALLRIDRPVGYWLLLWPTLWGLLAASHGRPELKHLIIFVAGVFLMRSAGCVINDFADRRLDPHVERTRERPLAAGRIGDGVALIGFGIMMLIALLLVLQLEWFVVQLAVIGAALATAYPFMKRFIHMPQAWLGMSFGWGAVMAWAAVHGTVTDSPVPWLIFAANILWSISYDTAYALGDRDDDRKMGMKSAALWFGAYAVPAIILFAAGVLALLAFAAESFGIGVWFGWLFAVTWQGLLCMRLLAKGEGWGFNFFLASHWMGAFFALGFVIDGLLH